MKRTCAHQGLSLVLYILYHGGRSLLHLRHELLLAAAPPPVLHCHGLI